VMAAASKQVKMATANLITQVAYAGGEFQFEEDGVMAPVTSASGAQKAHIGTAVRIGLARALYGSNSLLILDEPTESMSERNALGLSASLVGAAKQTLLITHREQDQSLAANIIQLGA
jgi:ABC-type transport system involved in cytochrome bd biosynthesis fused ATPase/permease subunit